MSGEKNNQQYSFLIITDQVDSSRNPTEFVPHHTSRHFGKIIEVILQENYNSSKNHNSGKSNDEKSKDKPSIFIVKNIGDSLMIRTKIDKNKIGKLLYDFLSAQRSLQESERGQKPTKIRILIARLQDNDYIEGEKIKIKIEEEKKEIQEILKRILPPARWNNNWLSGDVFGPNVALAFRAAGIPSKDILFIQEEVAELLDGYNPKSSFEININNNKLYISKPVAFSPLKGLNELYEFGKSDRSKNIENPWWKGHLFLRAVSNEKAKEKAKVLELDQQKIRVFAKVYFKQNASDLESEIKQLIDELQKEEGNAGYIKSIGRVKRSYPDSLSQSNSKSQLGLIYLIAVPFDDTYDLIRGKIEEAKIGSYLYTASTFVYSKGEVYDKFSNKWQSELDTLFYQASNKEYIIVFARWIETMRNSTPRYFKNQLNLQDHTIYRCGQLMGEKWDIYCIIISKKNSAESSLEEIPKEIRDSCDRLKEKQCIDDYECYLCEEYLEIKRENQ